MVEVQIAFQDLQKQKKDATETLNRYKAKEENDSTRP